MEYELRKVFSNVNRQPPIALVHEELHIPIAFRADLIIEDKVVVKLKSIDDFGKL